MKVLFVTSEAAPFAKTGGLADVLSALPKNLVSRQGVSVSVVLPLYASVGQEWREKMDFVKYIYVRLSWRTIYCGIFRMEHEGVTCYFIDNEYYFKRDNLYGYYDDGERFAFFCRAVCDILPHIDFKPDVIHLNDWQTALAPVYLRGGRGGENDNIKLVFTIHNIEYQGKFGVEILADVFGLDQGLGLPGGVLEYKGCVNLMKGAMELCDSITTVSPTYAEELKYDFFVHGLGSVVERNSHKLKGILNGIDTDLYNPKTNPYLEKNYSDRSLAGKAENKAAMQRMLGLAEDADTPVISVISRLVSHKGIDLVLARINEIMALDLQFVLIGRGDWSYERTFAALQGNFEGRFSANITYSEDLANRVYAGSDIFLMPSQVEPCGLSQMIAMRYGTLPVVRETGGLKDTVKPYVPGTREGTGFTFANFNADDMLSVLKQACETYRDQTVWKQIMRRAMTADFSWDRSAAEYKELYKSLCGKE